MKKNIFRSFFSICLLFLVNISYSQDTIRKIDSTLIVSKIIEVADSIIKFRKIENLNGPIYSLHIRTIAEITYSNGYKEVYNLKDNFSETNHLKLVGTDNKVTQSTSSDKKSLLLRKAINEADTAKVVAILTEDIEDWKEVINRYSIILGIDSTYAPAFYYIGIANESIKNYREALKFYKQYLLLFPNSIISNEVNERIFNIENILLSEKKIPHFLKNKLDEANKYIFNAKKTNTVEAWQNVIKEYKSIITLDSSYAYMLFYFNGKINELLLNNKTAILNYENFLKYSKDSYYDDEVNSILKKLNPNYYVVKSEDIYYNDKPFQDENATIDEAALKRALNRAGVAEEIAKETNSKEDWISVINEYKKAEEIENNNSFVFGKLAYAYEAIQDFDNAIKYYKKILIEEPTSLYSEEIKNHIDRIEYRSERNFKNNTRYEFLKGTWVSDLRNEKNGRPYWILSFDEGIDNEIRVSISPKSELYYGTYTYTTAIATQLNNKLAFMFTTNPFISENDGKNIAANVMSTFDPVERVISNSPISVLGTASQLLYAIPKKKKVELNREYIFGINISNELEINGKYNLKEYKLVENQKPKISKDLITDVKFSKVQASELDSIKNKRIYETKRKPSTSFFLSLIFPGGGQLYNKQYEKFAVFSIAQIGLAGLALITMETIREFDGYYYYEYKKLSDFGYNSLVYIVPIIHLISMIDAPIASHKINKEGGFAHNTIIDNNNLCLKVNPNISTLTIEGKQFASTNLTFKLSFK